jgi:hypothetical protein
MTFGLSSSSRLAYSTKPIATNATASASSTARHCAARRGVHGTRASSANSSANGT